jgi:hypothetical protein
VNFVILINPRGTCFLMFDLEALIIATSQ